MLQDGRLVDLPLSGPFLKLIAHPALASHYPASLEGVLSLDDFEEVCTVETWLKKTETRVPMGEMEWGISQVHPVKGRFLKELTTLIARKRSIESDASMDRVTKRCFFHIHT